MPFLLHPRQLTLQASQILVPWRPGATEGDSSRAQRLALPTSQQGVANPKIPGYLSTADARLAGLLNRTTLEHGTQRPTL